MLRGGCVCWEVLCAVYNFYFWLLIPHLYEMLESLEGHLLACPMSTRSTVHLF